VEIVPSGFEENLDKNTLGPFEYCVQTGKCLNLTRGDSRVATRKAMEVYEQLCVRHLGANFY